MKSARWLFAGLMGMMMALPACSDDTQEGSSGGSSGEGGGSSGEGGGGTGGFTVAGTISGETVPEDAEVVVLWVVTSGDPNYSFNFGEGSVSGATFTVGFGSAPPREALDKEGVGVGIVTLFPPGTGVTEGKVSNETIQTALLGASARYAIIWRDPSAPGFDWSESFPAGFGCGKCVLARRSDFFESFEPVDCSEVEIQAASGLDSLDLCHWT
ncbi:hypothetical protein [Sorangium sp. So ce1000]|uniref:hypothetical protein n=1 Tax=Sorangium sp. So ce1000 TaxID=3133325 RepID=UPI003F6454D8